MTDREKMIEVIAKRFAHLHDFECDDLADRLIAAGFAGVEKIGETINVPGSGGGFTMAVFNGREVPLGTDVFMRRS